MLSMLSHSKGLVLLALFYINIVTACSKSPSPNAYTLSGPTMGTHYTIQVVASDERELPNEKELHAQVTQLLEAINASMSTYIDNSELSRFNRASIDQWFDVSADLCDVAQQAKRVYQQSEGAFDATVGPLVNAWGFGPVKYDEPPSQTAIDQAFARVGTSSLDVDCVGLRLKKSKAIYLDLSAIAKGFATDKVATLLMAADLDNFMVEIGGELFVSGVNKQGEAWRIAVEQPDLQRGSIMQILSVSDVGVATSGEYRNYYEVDGQRISHTIDPVTGRPIIHKLASVTVIAETGALADAWATALNVLGPQKAYSKALEYKLPAYFIVREDDKFVVNYTPYFESYMADPL